MFRVAGTVALLLSLLACERFAADSVLADYPQRLANVTQSHVHLNPPLLQVLPPISRNSTAAAMQAQQLDITDWWQLKDCDFQHLLAQRNSSLGRVQQPSIRLRYEVEILMALQHCVATTESQSSRDILLDLIPIKTQQIKAVWQHMWVSDPSLVALFGVQEQPITDNAGLVELEKSLQHLSALFNAYQDGNLPLTLTLLSDLEQHLQSLHTNTYLPQLWFGLREAQGALQAATTVLSHSEAISCHLGKPSADARQAQTFFRQYYVSQVQPYIAQLNAGHRRIAPLLNRLSQTWPETLQQRLTLLTPKPSVTALTKSHAIEWQKLFKRCGLATAG
ncbi:DUF3080 family protein [Echinimonas agarilytica]|uniref:DUF3080 domain-containing protein n=1 Tax=Echinimonas agarilytica TaxID=1215918 RepID=A0AA42B743_9GAMM|nr:DUF3080 family protein [Echinimonas agarilytica]MCM2679479.1 DUF3080 domain-containing protein [Echinimonas agarilytica]